MSKRNNILFLALFLLPFCLSAQTASYKVSGSSKMKITGSSNVHEWEENVNKTTGNASMDASENFQIDQLVFKAEVTSIKSTKGSIMDNKTYEALKSDKHPYIIFELDKVLKASPVSGGYWLNTQGYLTIAGTKKLVKLDVKAILNSDGSIAFEGTKVFNMSEFGIDPPTAMMGSMKVGDEVKIKFKIYYNKY